MNDLIYISIFVIVGIGFVLGAFIFSWILRPHKPDPKKLSTYECGELPIGLGWVQYNVCFYIFALIFVIFDIEVIFLLPWAVVFRNLGIAGFVEMMIFIGILLIGLAYAWAKGALKWAS